MKMVLEKLRRVAFAGWDVRSTRQNRNPTDPPTHPPYTRPTPPPHHISYIIWYIFMQNRCIAHGRLKAQWQSVFEERCSHKRTSSKCSPRATSFKGTRAPMFLCASQTISRAIKYSCLPVVYKMFTGSLECDSASPFWGLAAVFIKRLKNCWLQCLENSWTTCILFTSFWIYL